MPDNLIDTSLQSHGGEKKLPLHAFFTSLKLNGFLVTPEQIIDANKIVSNYSTQVENDQALCSYLSPIFARNQEEQQQFEEIFNSYFNSQETPTTPPDQDVKKHLQKHWWKYVSAIVVMAVIIFTIIRNLPSPVLDPKPKIYLHDKDEIEKIRQGRTAFQLRVNEKLETYTEASNIEEKEKQNTRWVTRFNWGDGKPADTVSSHVYEKGGNFNVAAYTDVFYKNVFQYTDTVSEIARVCSSDNSVAITTERDSLEVGKKIKLKAATSGKEPDSIKWMSDERTLGYGKELEISFDQEGQQSVYCVSIYDSLSSPCTIQDNIDLNVYDPNKPAFAISINKAANAEPITLRNKVKPVWFYLSGGVSFFSFLLTVFFAVKSSKQKKKRKEQGHEADEKLNQLLNSFSGKKLPAELPFQSKNYLPVPEPEINEAATEMRRRINNEARFLQVQQTIEKSISNHGFFEPVYVPRLQQSEYLVLIDASHNNNQQVKLFDYLIEILKKQNVSIEKYYYRYEPSLCFNSLEPNGVSLEKLSGKYDKNILLIFGNAYQLLYQFYPVFNNEYLQLLNRWEYKAILTPVSFLDWSNKEINALLPQLPVIPVDVEGQLELMDTLFTSDFDIIGALKTHQKAFYPVAPIDFENINELRAYCDKVGWASTVDNGRSTNILFQWIAALAVYPKIRWETTLALGKAILDKYDKTEELNFTNLLRIARIKWMKEGQFPDYTRLDLLKELTIENEIIARETVLSLLNEIPASEMNEKHFGYEEKETQRITNEFILYAYDPEKYAAFKESKELFEKLWKEKKIVDAPSQVYLKNEERQWSTLINKAAGKNNQNVPIAKYFEPEAASDPGRKDPLLLVKTFSLLFLISVAGLLFFTVLHFINTNRFAAITFKPPVKKEIRFNLANSTANAGRMSVSIDSTLNVLAVSQPATISLMISDSLKPVSVYSDTRRVYDSAMSVAYNAYDIYIGIDSGQKRKVPLKIYYEDSSSLTLATTLAKTIPSNFIAEIEQQSLSDTAMISLFYFSSEHRQDGSLAASAISGVINRVIQPQLADSANFLKAQADIVIYVNSAASCTPVTTTALPQSLNEIWRGGTSNRLININFAKKVIYYSVNDTRTYGTYGVDEICLTKNGAYKIITRTNQGYKLFFIRKINRQSFELSVCQDFVQSKSDLIDKDETYCDRFNSMSWYYENDPDKIFLPVNGNTLAVQEKQKLDKKAGIINTGSANSIYKEYQFRNFNNVVLSKQAISQILSNSNINVPFNSSSLYNNVKADNPFQRSYLSIDIGLVGPKYAPDCNRTFSSIDETKKLASPLIVCRLDLSKEQINAIPKELYTFKNLRQLDLGTVSIQQAEINQLQKTLPNCKINYRLQGANDYSQNAPVVNNSRQSCDTINSYVGLGKGNIVFRGKTYNNIPLDKYGIKLSLVARQTGYAVFRFSKTYCKDEEVNFKEGQTQTINLCDGTTIRFTFLDWENKAGNIRTPEAIFSAIICESQSKKGS